MWGFLTPNPVTPMIACPQQMKAAPGLESLAELELQIARRADELAATRIDRSSLNLVCWLQAEQEILDPILKQSGAQIAQRPPFAIN